MPHTQASPDRGFDAAGWILNITAATAAAGRPRPRAIYTHAAPVRLLEAHVSTGAAGRVARGLHQT